MKRGLLALSLLAVSAFFAFSGFSGNPGDVNPKSDIFQGRSYADLPTEKTPVSSPDIENYYFSRWHNPDGAVFTPDKFDRMWNDINRLPDERNVHVAVNNWSLLGPMGQNVTGSSAKYSGRQLDIKVENVPSTRIASASGGLWGFIIILFIAIPVNLSENIPNTQVIGSFDSKPTDANLIIVGTGEPYQRGGSGMWRTTNGGTTWTNITGPGAAAFYKVRWDPINASTVHATNANGYYKSTDDGQTWTKYLNGDCSDLAINQSNSNIVYVPVWGDGLYKSTNAGLNFSKVTTSGIPTSNVGRTAVSICKGNTNIVYVGMGRNDNNNTLGAYKSTNDGASWTTVTPNASYLGGQAWYDNFISVCPTNSNIVLAGGVGLWRSTNGGTSWTQVSDPNVHADQHCATWSADGNSVHVGNDGGDSFSNGDQGATWITSGNILPITQYVNIDVGTNNTSMIFGGSQDNGMSGTTNGGSIWNHTLGGDGGGVAIDPLNGNNVYITLGVYGGSWAFQRLKSTDMGQTWPTAINSGIDPSGQWYHKIRIDRTSPVYLYNNSGNFVYRSTNNGTAWTKLNATAFPTSDLTDVVCNYNSSAVYAILYNDPVNANKLQVYTSGSWTDRSAGLPNQNVKKIGLIPTSTNPFTAYAVMNGTGTPGQKIYKTTNAGANWTNITGDMADIPLSDILPHPTDPNKLYLSSEMGCYRTTNGGTNWHRWNNGMHPATIVSELKFIDSLTARGKFYVVAGTYGRSMYMREIAGDDPVGIGNVNASIPARFELKQNYPNPFNPETNIEFALPKNDKVEVKIFDLSGKEVATLYNGDATAGTHIIKFDGSKISSGVYFYKVKTSSITETRKMMLVK
jgi:photosystem II stability/assembly factor-like uncharacterized protein